MARSLASIDASLARMPSEVALVQAAAVRVLRSLAQQARQSVAYGFQQERTYRSEDGSAVPVKPYGTAWGAIKRRMGYSMKKGKATGGVQRVLNRRDAVKPIARGFMLDFLGASLRTTTTYRNRRVHAVRRGGGPFRRPATMRTLVFNYISFFADQKANGLGNMPTQMRKLIASRVQAEVERQLAAVAKRVGVASSLRGGVRVRIRFSLAAEGL